MLQFKHLLIEIELATQPWQFISQDHAFDRLNQRTQFQFADSSFVKTAIIKKTNGLRFGEYGFISKRYNKIFVCEVDPRKKHIKVITILNGDMKLKQGTPKIITESIAESLEYILLD